MSDKITPKLHPTTNVPYCAGKECPSWHKGPTIGWCGLDGETMAGEVCDPAVEELIAELAEFRTDAEKWRETVRIINETPLPHEPVHHARFADLDDQVYARRKREREAGDMPPQESGREGGEA